MNRRGFLTAILAASIAPAVCKAANLMPVFVRRESGLLLPSEGGLLVHPSYAGAFLKLFNSAGLELAAIPMEAEPAAQGVISMSGFSPIVRTGVFKRAVLDTPGLGRREVGGLTLNTPNLMMGDIMNMNIAFGADA